MEFENISDIWEVVKDRPLGELLNYLNDESKKDSNMAMIYAASAIGAYHFARHITGEE